MTQRRATNIPDQEEEFDEGHELRMGFFEHLAELRDRLIRAVIALAIGTGLGAVVSGQVLDYLRSPYCRVTEQAADCRLIILGPTGGVIAYFQVALLVGAALAIPVITYQFMMFILPGLKPNEKRYIFAALPAITGLFVVGVLFAWFVLMPPALGFLESFQPTLFEPEWTAELYLSFVTRLIFWMGVAFETPLVFFVLSLLGFVAARDLIHHWRIAIVGSSIAAALITPTVDPVNMVLVMGPLLVLYMISIVLVFFGHRRFERGAAS